MPVELSRTILFTLLLMLAGAAATFSLVIRRLIEGQRRERLHSWLTSRGAGLVRSPWQENRRENCVVGMEALAGFSPRGPLAIQSPQWSLAELTTVPPMQAKGKTPHWRLLSMRLPADMNEWPTTALRPAAHAVSVVDLPALSSYPSLATTDRFMVFGCDATAARRLAVSPAQRILPQDVGLLLSGNRLILDFSPREFEPVEFERMLKLGEELVKGLADNKRAN